MSPWPSPLGMDALGVRHHRRVSHPSRVFPDTRIRTHKRRPDRMSRPRQSDAGGKPAGAVPRVTEVRPSLASKQPHARGIPIALSHRPVPELGPIRAFISMESRSRTGSRGRGTPRAPDLGTPLLGHRRTVTSPVCAMARRPRSRATKRRACSTRAMTTPTSRSRSTTRVGSRPAHTARRARAPHAARPVHDLTDPEPATPTMRGHRLGRASSLCNTRATTRASTPRQPETAPPSAIAFAANP
jgi:hypothetical protein